MKRFALPLVLALLCTLAAAQDVASFEKRTTVKKLDNGLTVLICERPEAPVFSFYTHVDAGSAQDPLGKTGLAHMFEHMAFKGTDKIGTTDYSAEKVALAKVETAYAAYIDERDRRIGRDEQKVEQLRKVWQDAITDANQYVKPEEFSEIIESNGGEGLNASTDDDETTYYYSFPSNRLELWAYLESERFMHPVMREFYKERDVVIEERRMRTDSRPIGRLLEQFVTAAFQASQYHRPTIGWMADLNTFSATDARKFFDEYYVPSNMVVAVVGDLKASEAMPVIEKYFGRIPSHEKPDERDTTEPPQNSERRVVLQERAQPLYLEGYQHGMRWNLLVTPMGKPGRSHFRELSSRTFPRSRNRELSSRTFPRRRNRELSSRTFPRSGKGGTLRASSVTRTWRRSPAGIGGTCSSLRWGNQPETIFESCHPERSREAGRRGTLRAPSIIRAWRGSPHGMRSNLLVSPMGKPARSHFRELSSRTFPRSGKERNLTSLVSRSNVERTTGQDGESYQGMASAIPHRTR